MTASVFIYFGNYYHASENAAAALAENGADGVKVTEADGNWLFDGSGTETALIFYPGAKVEAEAYAPLMRRIAEGGTDCFLCRMPFNFALFDKDRAEVIRDIYDYEYWYIAGHSLGGVAASMIDGDSSDWDGLILLASYAADLLSQDCPVLLIYGTEDGVLSMDKYHEAEEDNRYPEDVSEVIIEGGNHAGFGDYGEQKGDGTASISAEEQQEQTAEAILEMTQKGNADD